MQEYAQMALCMMQEMLRFKGIKSSLRSFYK